MSSMYRKSLEANLWKFVLQNILDRRIYWPILAVYYVTLPGSTLEQVGYYMAIGSFAGALLEVPSGYLSDKIGHRNGLLLAALCLLVGSLSYFLGTGFVAFAVGAVMMAAGNAFDSGTRQAYLHETLQGLGKDDQYAQISARISGQGHLVSAVLLALIPATAAFDLRLPILFGVLFDLTCLVIVASMAVPHKTQVAIKEISQTNFLQVLREARRRHYLSIALFGGLLVAIPTALSIYRDLYQQSLGISVAYLGALLALSRVVAGLAAPLLSRLYSRFTMKQFYMIEVVVTVLAIYLIGLSSSRALIATLFILLVGFLWGSRSLSQAYQLDYIGTSHFKATLFSLEELTKVVFLVGLQLLLGTLVDRFGYQLGFIHYATFSLVTLLGLYLFMVFRAPTIKKPAWQRVEPTTSELT